jgi:hypothetical protein
MLTTVGRSVALEPAAQAFVEANAIPPFHLPAHPRPGV